MVRLVRGENAASEAGSVMHIPVDQRPCANCGKTTYTTTAVWNFAHGPQCLCVPCFNDHFHFTPEGMVIRGLRGTARPLAEPTVDLDAAIARANEDTHERMREASARRWTPEARAEMSRMRKAYWAQKRGQV